MSHSSEIQSESGVVGGLNIGVGMYLNRLEWQLALVKELLKILTPFSENVV